MSKRTNSPSRKSSLLVGLSVADVDWDGELLVRLRFDWRRSALAIFSLSSSCLPARLFALVAGPSVVVSLPQLQRSSVFERQRTSARVSKSNLSSSVAVLVAKVVEAAPVWPTSSKSNNSSVLFGGRPARGRDRRA